ncbi:hypothetical protein [Streptomyces sp. NBC_00083]|uniref:hypothetical protein n=1 Tax=Streptomyces sp. NBC_00083 TaxID=2975647 RepID=UPI00225492AA|nr:hypothetical protein [Streptomyces sp. NBC_00083]MCX5388203.1 hypothetical protein [Streptomyces sp. NBC_00083]
MVLLAGGLAAACGSGGPTVGDSDASCAISAQPTVTGVTTAYQVTLSAATNEVGYFEKKASVTVSGGLSATSTTSEALGTPISVPSAPGTYFVQASVPLASGAPSNYRGVQCRLTLTVNPG